MNVRGLMNIQFVIMRAAKEEGDQSNVYVLEVNPRSSRTVPFLSKVTRVPMVQVAIDIMLGHSLADLGYAPGLWPARDLVAIKAPVFSMSKLAGVDTYLGPEMKSTGEVMGIDHTYERALAKALLAADAALPPEGAALLSIADRDKPAAIPIIRNLGAADYTIFATAGTADLVRGLGFQATVVPRLQEGVGPNVVDVIRNKTVNFIVNTPEGQRAPLRDGFEIRRAAAEERIPCFTSIDTAAHAVAAMVTHRDDYSVLPLGDYTERTGA